MISGLTWLLGCQLAGEVVVRLTGLPLPGPVVGMVLLLVLLQLRRPRPEATVFRAADGLLRHLQLFFVPAGVGVVAYLGVIGGQAAPIVVALAASWAAGLLAVAGLTVALVRDRVPGE